VNSSLIRHFDIAIVGGGLSGLITADLPSENQDQNLAIAIIDPDPSKMKEKTLSSWVKKKGSPPPDRVHGFFETKTRGIELGSLFDGIHSYDLEDRTLQSIEKGGRSRADGYGIRTSFHTLISESRSHSEPN
jgi:hypothetical protein